ncbi:MAG: transposase [Candidatus Aminicenantes bacterium]|nr:transposase [Candidatus Aminicenantes bacterium]
MSLVVRCQEVSDDAVMNDWGRMLRKWQRYILSYFNHRTTNAYTEGVHTEIKLIKKMSLRLQKCGGLPQKSALILPACLLL